jgi:hypothetical protein
MAAGGGRLSGATRTAATATRPGRPDALPERFDPGQLATLGTVASDWLAALLAVGPTDRDTAEAGVRQAYRAAGLAPPERVVWFGSPLAGAVAVALLTGLDADIAVPDPRWERVRDELERQDVPAAPDRIGRPVRPRIGPVLWAEVRTQLRHRMGPILWDQAWIATAGALLGRLPERIWYLQLEAGGPIDTRVGWRATERLRNQAVSGTPEVVWCAVTDGLCQLVPGLPGPERLAGLRRVTRAVGWWWPFERLAVMTDRPVALHRDEQDELHCADGPALAYPDGFVLHAWRGRPVPGELIARLPGLRADDITAEPNLELRRVMTEWYGLDRYLRDAGGRVVGQDTYGRLWRLDRPEGEPLVMVEVVNSTPEPDGSHAIYWLRVPPDIRSAHAAVAWTFRLNEGNYRPLAES